MNKEKLAKIWLKRNSWIKDCDNNLDPITVFDKYLSAELKKPKRYTVIAKTNNGIKVRESNYEHTALNYETRLNHRYGNATIYENKRFDAELRLYKYINRLKIKSLYEG